MMLRTFTAPSSSMSLRIAYKRSGENWKLVSFGPVMSVDCLLHLPRSTTYTATRPV